MSPSKERCSFLIVSPMRNESENVSRLVQCVRSQDFLDWKWLIFENSSSDDTGSKLIDSCSNESRIRIINSKKHLSVADSFNTVLSLASSLYDFDAILILSGDDYLGSSTFLSRAFSHIMLGYDLIIPICILENSDSDNLQPIDYGLLGQYPSAFKLMLKHATEASYGNIIHSVITKDIFIKLQNNHFAKFSSDLRSDWWVIHYLIRCSRNPIVVNDMEYIKCRYRKLPYDSLYYTARHLNETKPSTSVRRRYFFQEDFQMLFLGSKRYTIRSLPIYFVLYCFMTTRTFLSILKRRMLKF